MNASSFSTGETTGIDELDRQHQRILQTLHALGLSVDRTGRAPALRLRAARAEACQLLRQLYRQVDALFESEERSLELAGYGRLAEHQAEHTAFVELLGELQRELLRPIKGAGSFTRAVDDGAEPALDHEAMGRISDSLRRLEANYLADRVAAVEDWFVDHIVNDDEDYLEALRRAQATGALGTVLESDELRAAI